MHALLQAAQIKDKHQTKDIHNNIQTLNYFLVNQRSNKLVCYFSFISPMRSF